MVYLCYEIYLREIDGLIRLANELVAEGLDVSICAKGSVFDASSVVPPGVFFLKSIVPGEVPMLRKLKKFGHTLVSLDAEGLITENRKFGVEKRFSEFGIHQSAAIFVWGEMQKKRLARVFPASADKTIVTGSPRADLWKQKADVNTGKSREVLVVASSFGLTNHRMGSSYLLELELSSSGREVLDRHFDQWQSTHDVKAFLFDYYVDLVNHISLTHPELDIIIKPHPAEDPAVWRDKINSQAVQIITEQSIEDLVESAAYLLHINSTTTAVATAAGARCICFLPKHMTPRLLRTLHPLPLAISEVISETEAIGEVLSLGPLNPAEKSERLKKISKYCLGFDSPPNDKESSVSRIARHLVTIERTVSFDRRKRVSALGIIKFFDLLMKRYILIILGTVQFRGKVLGSKYVKYSNFYSYRAVKQPKISAAVLSERSQKIGFSNLHFSPLMRLFNGMYKVSK